MVWMREGRRCGGRVRAGAGKKMFCMVGVDEAVTTGGGLVGGAEGEEEEEGDCGKGMDGMLSAGLGSRRGG